MSQPQIQQQQLKVLFHGTCACTRITYTCTAVPTSTTKCHCTTCRKLSGAAYQAFLDLPSESLTFTDTKLTPPRMYSTLPGPSSQAPDEGEGIRILKLSDVGDRLYCANCFTPLAMRYFAHEGVVHVTLGSVDEDSIVDAATKEAMRPQAQIFYSQRAWWDEGVTVGGGGRVHERFGGDFEAGLQAGDGNGVNEPS